MKELIRQYVRSVIGGRPNLTPSMWITLVGGTLLHLTEPVVVVF